MNVFWWAKTGDKVGMYAIGLGSVEIAVITAPDDALAAQWTECCANALNKRERYLRALPQNYGIDAVFNDDGTVNEVRSEARRQARDRWEANSN